MELFNQPSVFIYMIFAALLLGALWYFGAARAEKARKLLFSAENYAKLVPQELKFRRRIKDILFLTGLFFFFAALAGPQWGRQKIDVEASYSQAVIAVDVSLSMQAEDVKPNRMAGAKTMLSMLIDSFARERAGIVAFTSRAFMQCPVTSDVGALKSLAQGLNVNMLPVPGTELAPAVNLAAKMLAPYPGSKAVVLITDGEDHNPKDLQAALKTARENDIKIIAVGIGSEEGELIPVRENGVKTYKKDKDGKTVLTKLDEKSLIGLASATGGVYIKFSGAQQTAEEIYRQMLMLDKSSSMVNGNVLYKNRYQIPLFIGFVLVLSSILIALRKVK